VIFQDFIPYLDSKCDYCISKGLELPKCAVACPEKAIEVKEVQEDMEQNIYFVGEHLAVHTLKWSKEDAQLPKKR
jgi:Fe-S-cluster-containing dehydrogenase component